MPGVLVMAPEAFLNPLATSPKATNVDARTTAFFGAAANGIIFSESGYMLLLIVLRPWKYNLDERLHAPDQKAHAKQPKVAFGR